MGSFAVYGCSCSLDLLANLAQLYPEAVLQAAFGRWQELAARYQAGLLAVMEGAISRLLHVSNAEMLEELLEDESNGGSAGLGLGDDRLEEGGAEEEEDAEGEAGALQSESSQLVR